ncbi:MAG: GNAT family N-acetyltransferase [Planctomycetota bacterium]
MSRHQSATEEAVVRRVRADELDALLELYQDLHADDVPWASERKLRTLWAEVLENPMLDYVAAEVDGRLVASCTLVIVPNLTRAGRPFALIENVVTHRDYRRRGLGTATIEYALDLAWASDCYKVMLLTGRKDPGVRRFYEQTGFEKDGKTGFIARPPAEGMYGTLK